MLPHVLFYVHGIVKMLACDYLLEVKNNIWKSRLVVVAFGLVIRCGREALGKIIDQP